MIVNLILAALEQVAKEVNANRLSIFSMLDLCIVFTRVSKVSRLRVYTICNVSKHLEVFKVVFVYHSVFSIVLRIFKVHWYIICSFSFCNFLRFPVSISVSFPCYFSISFFIFVVFFVQHVLELGLLCVGVSP